MPLEPEFENDPFNESGLIPNEEKLGRLSALANAQLELEDEIAVLNAKLESKTKDLNQISGEFIPGLMEQIGVNSFELSTGEKISVVEKVKASISIPNKPEAFKWLRGNGHGSLIKNEITTMFGKGEEIIADKFFHQIQKEGLDAKRKESVHASTLTAFVKELLSAGEKFPMDLLGVFKYNITKIKRSKT